MKESSASKLLLNWEPAPIHAITTDPVYTREVIGAVRNAEDIEPFIKQGFNRSFVVTTEEAKKLIPKCRARAIKINPFIHGGVVRRANWEKVNLVPHNHRVSSALWYLLWCAEGAKHWAVTPGREVEQYKPYSPRPWTLIARSIYYERLESYPVEVKKILLHRSPNDECRLPRNDWASSITYAMSVIYGELTSKVLLGNDADNIKHALREIRRIAEDIGHSPWFAVFETTEGKGFEAILKTTPLTDRINEISSGLTETTSRANDLRVENGELGDQLDAAKRDEGALLNRLHQAERELAQKRRANETLSSALIWVLILWFGTGLLFAINLLSR